mgnify:CR=1 FL=1
MQSTKTNDFKSLVYGLHILALMDLRTNHNTGNYAPTLGKQKDGTCGLQLLFEKTRSLENLLIPLLLKRARFQFK